MNLKRLLELAGYSKEKIDEAVAKYNEPKATHEVKTGGEKVKEPKEGKLKGADDSKYNETKANHAVKSGGEKAPKPAEGVLKTAPVSKYRDGNDTGAKPGLKSVTEAKKLAKKDYDKDGKLETSEEEHKGVVDKAIKSKTAKK